MKHTYAYFREAPDFACPVKEFEFVRPDFFAGKAVGCQLAYCGQPSIGCCHEEMACKASSKVTLALSADDDRIAARHPPARPEP